jgi:hypothetical protein
MANIVFSWSKPTPQNINTIVHTLSGVFAALIATVSQDQHISAFFKEEFALWGGLLVTIAQLIRPFLGDDTTEKTVPIDEVSAIK